MFPWQEVIALEEDLERNARLQILLGSQRVTPCVSVRATPPPVISVCGCYSQGPPGKPGIQGHPGIDGPLVSSSVHCLQGAMLSEAADLLHNNR